MLKTKNFKTNLVIFLIGFFIILTVIFPLLNKGFPRTHDANLFMTWLYEFDQGFREGNLLPRWQGNLWFGYGAPVFNFFQPFFYYLGEGFHLIGFSLLNSVKIVIILSVIFSFLFMFLLAKEFWGRWTALVLATLYIFLPYRIGLLYIRGNFSEYLAMAWFPLIFFSFYKFLKTDKLVYFLLSSFSIALLFLTHNIQTVLFLPVLVIYIVVFYWGKIKKYLKLALAILFGALLTGFFWIPAFFERKYTQIERLATGRYDFHNHFVGFRELFLPHWGGGDFFQVGVIGVLIIGFAIYVSIKHKKIDFNSKHLLFFLILVLFCLFLTTSLSNFIWENIPLLAKIQFPWRILSLITFGLVILASIVIFPEFYKIFIKKLTNKFFVILTLFILVFSSVSFIIWNTAKPILYMPAREDYQYNVYYQLLDETNIIIPNKDEAIKQTELNVYPALPDILPKGIDYDKAKDKADNLINSILEAVIIKGEPFFIDKLVLLSGKAEILESKILVEEYQFSLKVEKEAKMRVNTFWFPGWHAYVDGKEVKIEKDNELGLMDINVPEGKHVLRVEFHNTPLRNIAAYISLIAFSIFLGMIIYLISKKFYERRLCKLKK